MGLDTESPQYLQPWRVEGFCLNPSEAVKFLAAIPLNAAKGEDAFLGGDLRFWSQVSRWSLDLISRCKFLPRIQRQSDGAFAAKWQVLLDSAVDGTRLEKFSADMPLVCRTYQEGLGTGEWGVGEDEGAGEEKINNQCPMPNAQCPMPNLCKLPCRTSRITFGISQQYDRYASARDGRFSASNGS